MTSSQNQRRSCSPATRSHTTHRDHLRSYLNKPRPNFEDSITDEMIAEFKRSCFYAAPLNQDRSWRIPCPSGTPCTHHAPDSMPFELPFLCERYMGGPSSPRRIYIQKHRAHHKLFLSRLAKRARCFLRALSRCSISFPLQMDLLNQVGDYLEAHASTLAFPVSLRPWLIRRHHTLS